MIAAQEDELSSVAVLLWGLLLTAQSSVASVTLSRQRKKMKDRSHSEGNQS